MDRLLSFAFAPADSAGERPGNRVEFFRRLFLVFALASLGGVVVAQALSGGGRNLAIMATVATGLASWWVWWHRRGDFPAWSGAVEMPLAVAFALGVTESIELLGVCFVASQYRAMFGGRRAVLLSTAFYAAAFAGGLLLAFGAPTLLRPITLVQLFALFFGPYLASTLAAVLRRHARQVSELRVSENALRESEQRFRSVVDCLREAVLITDTEDRIILANTRVREVLGYDPGEVVGHIASDLLLPPTQRNVFSDRLRRRLSGETELYEAELVRKDGSTIFAEISASPYRGLSGAIIGTLGAISDITDRKRLEDRVRQSMRLEAVGHLAGGVAHDFNNLLTVVKCHTELMLGDLPGGSPARESVIEIERAVDKGASLIQQLLAFSRQQVLQPRRITLAQAVSDAAPILRGMLSPGVELVVVPEEPGDVFVDPLQIEHVLVTLVRNANEAMPAGGRIIVETRTRAFGLDDPRVIANEAAAGRYSVLVVSDNGTGMSKDVLKRIFEPFFTTKEPGEGTGLGLASMYGIVRQSGGFVDVESAPMTGTTFRVYLPCAPWETWQPSHPAAPAFQAT